MIVPEFRNAFEVWLATMDAYQEFALTLSLMHDRHKQDEGETEPAVGHSAPTPDPFERSGKVQEKHALL